MKTSMDIDQEFPKRWDEIQLKVHMEQNTAKRPVKFHHIGSISKVAMNFFDYINPTKRPQVSMQALTGIKPEVTFIVNKNSISTFIQIMGHKNFHVHFDWNL